MASKHDAVVRSRRRDFLEHHPIAFMGALTLVIFGPFVVAGVLTFRLPLWTTVPVAIVFVSAMFIGGVANVGGFRHSGIAPQGQASETPASISDDALGEPWARRGSVLGAVAGGLCAMLQVPMFVSSIANANLGGTVRALGWWALGVMAWTAACRARERRLGALTRDLLEDRADCGLAGVIHGGAVAREGVVRLRSTGVAVEYGGEVAEFPWDELDVLPDRRARFGGQRVTLTRGDASVVFSPVRRSDPTAWLHIARRPDATGDPVNPMWELVRQVRLRSAGSDR